MAPLRVLVADDNIDAAYSVSLLLRRWGHEPLVARDGPEALAVAPHFVPHVVLLDLAMPHMDGFEVGRRLRQLPGLEGLTLLAVTGLTDAKYRRRSEEAGFAAFLLKPIDPPELEALLNVLAAEKQKRGGAT